MSATPQTDWRAAGRLADARRVQNLLRQRYRADAKSVARRRVAEALLVAGGTRCLDLWGGGSSAALLTQSGLSVIAVENGSQAVSDERGSDITRVRLQRAMTNAAEQDHYEVRWGRAARFAHEADVAFLDFCGPWAREPRLTVAACRHMKAIAVTLLPDHNTTDASTLDEVHLAYSAYLKAASGGMVVRRLLRYKRPTGQAVFVYLLTPKRIALPKFDWRETRQLDPEAFRRQNAESTRRYRERMRQSPEWIEQERDRNAARSRRRWANDAERREYHLQYLREWRAAHPDYDREWYAKNRDQKSAAFKERYANDPEFRAKRAANEKAWRERRSGQADDQPERQIGAA